MVVDRKRDSNLEKNKKSDVWSRAGAVRSKKQRGVDEHAAGYSRGDWNKMAKARDENVRVAALKFEVRGRGG